MEPGTTIYTLSWVGNDYDFGYSKVVGAYLTREKAEAEEVRLKDEYLWWTSAHRTLQLKRNKLDSKQWSEELANIQKKWPMFIYDQFGFHIDWQITELTLQA